MTSQPKLPFELQPRESVVLFARRHWVYLAQQVGKVALLGIIPAAVVLVAAAMTVGLDGGVGRVFLAIVAAWLVYWAIRTYFAWYRYQHDVWIVTNQRIVDSLKRHWFHHRMASADLVDVEDIAVDREGVLQTAFNFGNLRCQTAGEQPNFILAGIPEPTKVLAIVDAQRDAARRELSGRV
ncbi:MAG TPA: hypothetical protein PKA49_10775 [Tepidiformaceae bacterium]|nr:hypothetical protein [Tepidiformaceae bacterium]